MNTAARKAFLGWTECLLDPRRASGEYLPAAQAWCAWALARLGVEENESTLRSDGFFADTMLSTGKAISPLGAARCVREHQRTAVFLQAVDAAIRAARERFPGETIHMLEAGCGPLAPLTLPFAVRYAPADVQFTLLDLHPTSLEAVKVLVADLGVADSVRAYLAADATTVRLAEADRPHLIACEVLLRALTTEPQVAATINLAPQLRPGGFFVPERIDVCAGIFHPAQRFQPASASSSADGLPATGVEELGRVFSLSVDSAGALVKCGHDRYAAGTVRVPPHPPGRLKLLTRIEVFRGHRLDDFDSSLNLPERLAYPAALAERGGLAEFHYEVSTTPGLRLTATPGTVVAPSLQAEVDGTGAAVC